MCRILYLNISIYVVKMHFINFSFRVKDKVVEATISNLRHAVSSLPKQIMCKNVLLRDQTR